MKRFGFLFAVLMIAGTAHAQTLQIGTPAYGGNGCPAGTLDIHQNTSGTKILIFPEALQVEDPSQQGNRFERKSCGIAIPIQVPAGYQVAMSATVQGFAHAQNQGELNYSKEIFFAGGVGPKISKTFQQTSQSFRVTPTLAEPVAWSPCGEDVNLRLNLSLLAKDQAMGSVDSMALKVRWKRCN